MAGINIEIASDVAGFLRGTSDIDGALGGVIDSLDDVRDGGKDLERDLAKSMEKVKDSTDDADDALKDLGKNNALDDVRKDADKAADAIDDKLTKETKDAGEEAKDTGKKFREVFDDVKTGSKTAGDDVKGNLSGGLSTAGENIQAFKEEAVQNISEVASSFSGDLDSAVDGVQGTLGGLATAIGGPIGLGLAGLGALGGAFYQQWKTAAEETEKRIGDMYDDMLASGNDYLSADFINTKISEIVKEPQQLADAQKIATLTGLDLRTVLQGLAGDHDALTTTQNALADATAAETARLDEMDAAGASVAEQGDSSMLPFLDSMSDKLTTVADNTATAADMADIYNDSIVTGSESAKESITAQGDLQQAIDDATEAFLTNGATLDQNTEAGRSNYQALIDLADAEDDATTAMNANGESAADVAAMQAQARASFVATAQSMGLSATEANKLADGLGLIPDSVTTDVNADTTQANSNVDAVQSNIADVPSSKTVTLSVNTSGAESAITSFINKPRQITVTSKFVQQAV